MDVPLRSDDVLLCFAVKEEAAFARELTPNLLITGMGAARARRAMQAALARIRPRLVLSCGFAGGLNPELQSGDVLFQSEKSDELDAALEKAGARRGRFYCASGIASTASQKRALREQTGADAVEMESEAIREVSRSLGLPCVTIRAISDAADEDLPLDFNLLLDANQNLRLGKLAAALALSPGKIPGLLRLRRSTRQAARRLAGVLARIIRAS